MFTVVITEKGGEQRRLDFDKPEVTIGRVQGNDIILPKGNVSKRHSRIVLKDGKFIIVDLKSTNGTYVNGRKITSPLVIKSTDKIYIGDFILSVEDVSGVPVGPKPAMPSSSLPMVGAESVRRPPPPLPKRKPRPMGGLDEEMGLSAEQSPPMPEGSLSSLSERHKSGPIRSPSSRTPESIGIPVRPPGARKTQGLEANDLGMNQNAVEKSPEKNEISLPVHSPQPTLPQHPPVELDSVPPFVAKSGASVSSQFPSVSSSPVSSNYPAASSITSPPSTSPLQPPNVSSPKKTSPPVLSSKSSIAHSSPMPSKAPAPEPLATSGGDRRQKISELQKIIHERLTSQLDHKRMDLNQLADDAVWEKTESTICDIVESLDGEGSIPSFIDQDLLIKDVLNEVLGLGPLEDLLANEDITEIYVNRAEQIFVVRNGVLESVETCFSSDKALMGIIARILSPSGRQVDGMKPITDGRLKDGNRAHVILPPLSVKGPALTIRKVRKQHLSADQFIEQETMSREMHEFLQTCINARKNILIAGANNAGKTLTLNVLCDIIPASERVVTVEEIAELQLTHNHWLALESSPINVEGSNHPIKIGDLLRSALQMKPTRLVVGEILNEEALELLQAIHAGQNGTLATICANSIEDALAKLERMVLLSGTTLPRSTIRELIAATWDILIYLTSDPEGHYRITRIAEMTVVDNDSLKAMDIFSFEKEGTNELGKVKGHFIPSGRVPRFYEDLPNLGLPVNMGIFRK